MNRKSSRREFFKSFCLSAGMLCAASVGMLSISPLKSWAAAPPAAPSRPLNIVTLGDSIVWGQGLPESMKFRTIVASWLQSQLPGRQVNQVATRAHSGAVTGFGAYPKGMTQDPDSYYKRNNGYPYPGEVPFGYPTVSYQIGMTLADLKARNINPQDIDLVMVDGGINDVHIQNILNFTDITTGPDWVRRITNMSLSNHMSQLLPQILTAFPNAAVVITGYYPIVSKSSDLSSLSALLRGQGIVVDQVVKAAKDAIAQRANAFADEAFHGLLNLVNQTNRTLGTPRVALAWPAFSDDNAYAAPDTYLFRVGQYAADEDRGKARQVPAGNWSTVQGVAYYRGEECSQFFSNDFMCYDASMGHPNPAGARAYADAVISKLQTVFWARFGLPAPPPAPQKMIVRITDSGTEKLAGAVWNWVIVSASDVANATPVKGATVTVNSQGAAAVPAAAGRSFYRGPIGQKIYYQNKSTPVRRAVGSAATERPETIGSRIKVTVAAPGYIAGTATIVVD
ncbi:MAG TPA: hypothetical protein VJA94_07160 [Candidatus Angelobacter sp.]